MFSLPPSSTLIVVPGQNFTTQFVVMVSVMPLGTYTVLSTRWVAGGVQMAFDSNRPPSIATDELFVAPAITSAAQSRLSKRIDADSAHSPAVSMAALAENAIAIDSNRMLPIAIDLAIAADCHR